jgi:hypothetical protein
VLVIACWQAFQARDIKSEFSEATYIGLAVFSMSQAFLTGIPIVVVVREIPQAFYLVLTFLIFLLCTVILLLIFLPKIFKQRAYAGMSQADQRKSMAMSVRKSSIHFSTISALQLGSAHLDPPNMQDGPALAVSVPLEIRQKHRSIESKETSTSMNEDSNEFKSAGLESKRTTANKNEKSNDFESAGLGSHNMQDGAAANIPASMENCTTESKETRASNNEDSNDAVICA